MSAVLGLLQPHISRAQGAEGGQAGCPSPTNAGQSGSYPAGAIACIVRFSSQSCPACKRGWRHRCDASGAWQPKEECLPSEERRAAADGFSTNASPDAGANQLVGQAGALQWQAEHAAEEANLEAERQAAITQGLADINRSLSNTAQLQQEIHQRQVAAQQELQQARQQQFEQQQVVQARQATLAQQQQLAANQQAVEVQVQAPAAPRTHSVDAVKCVSHVSDVWTGGISTESGTIKNLCNARVGYQYCLAGGDSDGPFDCAAQRFGAGTMSAGSTDGISIMGTHGGHFQVAMAACASDDPTSFPIPADVSWSSGQIHFRCP
jgi:hypothetical protein